MPVFVYRAADRRGQTIDGVMEAPDARAVVERLHREAYFPLRVAPHAERGRWLGLRPAGRVRGRDLLTMTQQLATLAEAGVPLDRALSILDELAPNPRLKTILSDLLRSVRGGASLSDALAKHHPRPFSRLYINMVRAGEKGGVLEVSLRRLAEFLESRAAFADALISALAYPVVITTVGAGAVVFLLAKRTFR
jgi:general secretion pathway protein F